MPLTQDDVRHIAKLARLTLSEEELRTLPGELSKILQYVDVLGEVDTQGVEPAAQVTGLINALRPDEIRVADATPDALLATSPLPIIDHQIQTPSAHG